MADEIATCSRCGCKVLIYADEVNEWEATADGDGMVCPACLTPEEEQTIAHDIPADACPACGAQSLMPVDSLMEEIERRVFEDTERWACACGYVEDRPAPPVMST